MNRGIIPDERGYRVNYFGVPGSEQEGIHTEPDAPPVEVNGGYQLYWEDVNPCRYYLAVNGTEPLRIEPRELNAQSRFCDWHLVHHLKPPPTEN